MLEFVFKKEAITELIQQSADPKSGNLVVKLVFEPRVDGKFPARITASCEDGGGNTLAMAAATGKVADGCPRPPGCD